MGAMHGARAGRVYVDGRAYQWRTAGCVQFFARGRRTARLASAVGARRAAARARRPRRAPAGPAVRAGYTGHQPPLQRARQRASAHGGSPHQAQCAGSKQRLPDGEDPAGGRQQPAAIHEARVARQRRVPHTRRVICVSPFGRPRWPLRREYASANRQNPAVSIKGNKRLQRLAQ